MKNLLPKFKERFAYWRNKHDEAYGKSYRGTSEYWMNKWVEAYENMVRLRKAIEWLKQREFSDTDNG